MTQQLIGGKFSATYPDTITGDVKPAVGYLVYTYVSGTTTPKTTWSDPLLATPNTNPVVLDSRGEASIFIGTGEYTIVLKTPGGALIWTRDGIVSPDAYSMAYTDLLRADLLASTGAGIVGFNSTTVAAYLKNSVESVVPSIAALKALDKTKYTKALTIGYYSAGDGSSSDYWYDPSDTTSTDNGGTVIVASDGARWKMVVTDNVTLKQFGAVGNANYYSGGAWFVDSGFVTPSHDDTTFIQAAITYGSMNFKTVIVPSGTPFLITSKVSATRAFSFKGDMPSPSEILSQSPHNKGSVICSTVAGDYTFEFGLYAGYERGMNWTDMRIFTKGTTTKGTILHSMGWDGYYRNVIHEGFFAGGAYFDYVQDSHFDNCSFIGCGDDSGQASLTFYRDSNQIKFTRCHFEITPYMMHIDNSSAQIYFDGCHFETSEYSQAPDASHPYYYPLPPLSSLNRYYKYPTIRIDNGAQNIDFSACTFGANTVQGNAVNNLGFIPANPTVFDGALEQSVPYMISCTATSVNFRGCFFLSTSASYSAKYIDFTTSNDCSVTDCFFSGCWTNGYSIVLSGVKFLNNTVQFNDLSVNYAAPYNLKFYGIKTQGSYCVIDDINLISANGAVSTKNEGYLFAHIYTGGKVHVLGNNNNQVTKFSRDHTAQFSAAGYAPYSAVDLAAATGNLNLEFYDINTLFKFTNNNPLSTITNPAKGQRVQIINNWAGGTVSVANTAIVNLKGGIAAPVSANYGILTLVETQNGNLVEESRNF